MNFSPVHWQHGWISRRQNFDPDLIIGEGGESSQQLDHIYLVAREDQAEALRGFGFPNSHAFGTPFAYALQSLGVPAVSSSRNILVAPAGHATSEQSVVSWPEDEEYIAYLRGLAGGLSDPTVMLHRRDISRGRAQRWELSGFRVLIGADATDSKSLRRQIEHFSQFGILSTNGIGSHVLYAAACGLKVSIHGPQPKRSPLEHSLYRNRPELIAKQDKALQQVKSDFERLGLYSDLFSAPSLQTWALHELGFGNVKSPESTRIQLREISEAGRGSNGAWLKNLRVRRRVISELNRLRRPLKMKLDLLEIKASVEGKLSPRPHLRNVGTLFLSRSKIGYLNFVDGGGLFFRRGSTDLENIWQHFKSRELEPLSSVNAETVVDLGCYAGYSMIFLQTMFPLARVVGVEPSNESWALAALNTANYPHTEVIRAAISSKMGKLSLISGEEGEWSSKTVSHEMGCKDTVAAVTIQSIISSLDIQRIDILKIDIEGSEYEFLENNIEWVSQNCGMVVVEYHNVYAHGEQIARIQKGFRENGLMRQWSMGEYEAYEFSQSKMSPRISQE